MTSEKKILKATHEGRITIGNINIPCAVLSDGSRIISYSAVFKAFGRTKKGKELSRQVGVTNMPVFLSANNLQPFVGADLKGVTDKIDYLSKSGKTITGFDAMILPLICKVYLDARAANALVKQQLPLARASEILLLGLSKVGIISLVDEATGYQYDREKQELQAILKAYISDEILEWQRTFQLSFYKEIFRLWNIPFTVENIKKKPLFIGKLTSELVYKNLPKGTFILEKLKEKTPKTSGGNYKYRLHQSLTPEIGREALKKVIYSIETLANISDSKHKFLRLVQDRYGQRELPFPDLEEIPETKKIANPTNFDKTLKGILSVPPPPKKDK